VLAARGRRDFSGHGGKSIDVSLAFCPAQNGKPNMEFINQAIHEIFSPEGFSALLQVLAIDLVLAGDNAIVIGLAAAGLPKELRARAILVGIIAATVMRIGFALITAQLLAWGPMVLVAGGLLLLWVCWKMWRELTVSHEDEHAATEAISGT
jgi:predicted tellurium resistance membrane protein TerC